MGCCPILIMEYLNDKILFVVNIYFISLRKHVENEKKSFIYFSSIAKTIRFMRLFPSLYFLIKSIIVHIYRFELISQKSRRSSKTYGIRVCTRKRFRFPFKNCFQIYWLANSVVIFIYYFMK